MNALQKLMMLIERKVTTTAEVEKDAALISAQEIARKQIDVSAPSWGVQRYYSKLWLILNSGSVLVAIATRRIFKFKGHGGEIWRNLWFLNW